MVFTVVSVEDELEIAELLRVVLDSPEIELHTVDNGVDGLAVIRKLQPDLVMLDVMMPEMSGWDVYDAIRADDQLKDTPVIMLTVMSEKPERRQEFAGSTIDLYVTKPFDTIRLRREVEQMLGQRGIWEMPPPRKLRPFTEADSPTAPTMTALWQEAASAGPDNAAMPVASPGNTSVPAAADAAEQPADAASPSDTGAEKPATGVAAEKPAEDAAALPAADTPAGDAAEKPAQAAKAASDAAGTKPVEKPANEAAEQSADESAADTADAAVGKPPDAGSSVGTAPEKSVQKPSTEKPLAEKPPDSPSETTTGTDDTGAQGPKKS
ncbi:MAG: response regulator [Chloroflexi bacterium]|nr:response regulator [Chloroflexota bacterium]